MRPIVKHWLLFALLAVSLAAMVAFSLWQMNRELTPGEARALATKLANQAFAEKQLMAPATQPSVTLVPEAWPAPEKKDGRWRFQIARLAGPQASVSFDLRGRKPEVRVSYAAE